METSLPLVSVVIPAYNVERYIEACIQSVIEQTYVNREIVIVDDGSTDGTLSIIRRYSSIYPYITVLEQTNKGPALARKAGLDLTKGKYIQYLDGDDTLLSDALESLVKRAEESEADIVATAFYFCRPEKEKESSVMYTFDETVGISYFHEILSGRGYWSLWSHFQKRSLFYDYGVKIAPDIYFGEDAIWMTQLLFHNPKVVSFKKPVLNYNINSNSISYRADIARKRHDDYRAYQIWIENYVRKLGYWDRFEKTFAILHLEAAQVSIQRKRFEKTFSDIKRIACALDNYPEIADKLFGKLPKLVSSYKKSVIWGYWRLRYYIMMGKI